MKSSLAVIAALALCTLPLRVSAQIDCNHNGIDDAVEIASGLALDCNNNSIPDSCDIAQQVGLGTGQAVVVNASPLSIRAADVTGNGAVDLVVVSRTDNVVSVLVNDGNGMFQAQNFLVGLAPESVAVGDFNGNGLPDLATANSGNDTVTVLLNQGRAADGTLSFIAAAPLQAGDRPTYIVAADLNGDGAVDLAVANMHSDDVTIFLNDGNAGFTPAVTEAVGSEPVSLAAGDFDGDGILDLAVANLGTNNISILLSSGVVVPPTPADFGSPISLAAGDFTNDGRADLAVANFNSSTVLLLQNDGTGIMTQVGVLTTPVHPAYVTFADMNGNGRLDLIVTDANEVLVFTNYGNNNFLATLRGSLEIGTESAAVGDFNRDGDMQVAVVNQATSRVNVLQEQLFPPASEDCNLTGIPDECEQMVVCVNGGSGGGGVGGGGGGVGIPNGGSNGGGNGDDDQPAVPGCGAGACGAGSAGMMPLTMLGLMLMRLDKGKGRRRK